MITGIPHNWPKPNRPTPTDRERYELWRAGLNMECIERVMRKRAAQAELDAQADRGMEDQIQREYHAEPIAEPKPQTVEERIRALDFGSKHSAGKRRHEQARIWMDHEKERYWR